MKCHYEVLDVSRDANSSDIKTAYRKLALKWHPDKNLNQIEEAKEQFQLIQQAYEVLSDPHERAWYDNHREQILRGKNSNYEDSSLDLFQYFSASCFKGYGDDPGGFFSVYREVFEKIRAEDAEFLDDECEIESIPTFGDSQSSYEDVVGPFYAYWQSYCTKKSYAWLSPYDISEIKDRRILREVEKDLKKIAQKAKKERNEEVRNLVAFVRKRDKRVQANKRALEERAALNRMKQERLRLEQIRRRQKDVEEHMKNNSSHDKDEYEEQLRQLAQEYADPDDDFDSETSEEVEDLVDSMEEVDIDVDAEDYVDALYCPACNKSFKNENAMLNHETSRKHRENLERLKDTMHTENETYFASSDLHQNNDSVNGENGGNHAENGLTADEDEYLDEEAEIEFGIRARGKKNKKQKKNKAEIRTHSEDEESIPDLLGDLTTEKDDWSDDNKKGRKSKAKKSTAKEKVLNSTPKQTKPAEEKSNRNPLEAEELPECDTNNCCVTCKSVFPSKNKLFQHLKSTGHGVYLPKIKPLIESSGKKKGKRNK